ncbi:class I SAM-dependent methyltransferase [Falsibacillus albus]|uniref:Class I SAM-dependent methyltransferase n=1 Tax=Falsibacillus albus TaxID=2478915 RepID=A0A3L7JS52_9BACI|nr:class I SAM-dependent methyltransferase [Falsibacillus albus]RLQ93687.1 class I SAM-dependent methyltransferase [Falsibacillus albus]
MTNQFDQKTKEYAIGRPGYPEGVLAAIKEIGIDEHAVIADIGAGTGLLTRMLGNLGCSVSAVEPNEEMLNVCRRYCEDSKNIDFIHASAEQTTLKENSVDLITMAQSFHWFDKSLCQKEFKRILKENGHMMTLWNDMQSDSEWEKEYISTLYRYKVKTTAAISKFDPDEEKRNFFGQEFTKVYFDHCHSVTEEGFIGGALSLSYTPAKTDHNYDEFVAELQRLFSKYQQNGIITFHYKTEVCVGQFAKSLT